MKPKQSLSTKLPLSVTPYGFGKSTDITETPLWSMIISGIWKPIMTPVSPRINFSIEPQASNLNPFVSRYYSSSETWSSVSRYLVQSRYWWTWFTRSHDITSSWPSHMFANFIDVISPSGPSSIFPSLGWTNPDLDHTPQHNPLAYLRGTFMITQLWCDI